MSEFDAAFLVAEDAALGDMEQGGFYDRLQRNDLLPDEESLNSWRSSDDYTELSHGDFDATFQQVAEDAALDDMEQGDFYEWLQINDRLPDE